MMRKPRVMIMIMKKVIERENETEDSELPVSRRSMNNSMIMIILPIFFMFVIVGRFRLQV